MKAQTSSTEKIRFAVYLLGKATALQNLFAEYHSRALFSWALVYGILCLAADDVLMLMFFDGVLLGYCVVNAVIALLILGLTWYEEYQRERIYKKQAKRAARK